MGSERPQAIGEVWGNKGCRWHLANYGGIKDAGGTWRSMGEYRMQEAPDEVWGNKGCRKSLEKYGGIKDAGGHWRSMGQ